MKQLISDPNSEVDKDGWYELKSNQKLSQVIAK